MAGWRLRHPALASHDMKITLLERLEDDFPITRIWIGELDGIPVGYALVGGVKCDIYTKPALLEAGLASINPVEALPLQSWPMQARALVIYDDGSTEERLFEAVSADARLVDAVRKMQALFLDGTAKPGTEF